MTEQFINAPPVCVRSADELQANITEALKIAGAGSPELQKLAKEAIQRLGAAAPAGAAV